MGNKKALKLKLNSRIRSGAWSEEIDKISEPVRGLVRIEVHEYVYNASRAIIDNRVNLVIDNRLLYLATEPDIQKAVSKAIDEATTV